MRKDQEEQNRRVSERAKQIRPHYGLSKKRMRIADQHYHDLDVKALEQDIQELYDLMDKLDDDVDEEIRSRYYKSKIERLEKEREEITVTDDSVSFLKIMACQRSYENSVLQEAREWAYEDLEESQTTGETRHKILASLVRLSSIEETLSTEAKNEYLSVVGDMFVNMTRRLGRPYRRDSLDIGTELYDRLLNQGDILRDTGNDLVYLHEEKPRRKGLLETLFDNLFLKRNIQFRGTRYNLNSEDGRQRFDEDYHSAGSLTHEEMEMVGVLISSPKPEVLEERVEPSEEESRIWKSLVSSANCCPPYVNDEYESCRGMH